MKWLPKVIKWTNTSAGNSMAFWYFLLHSYSSIPCQNLNFFFQFQLTIDNFFFQLFSLFLVFFCSFLYARTNVLWEFNKGKTTLTIRKKKKKTLLLCFASTYVRLFSFILKIFMSIFVEQLCVSILLLLRLLYCRCVTFLCFFKTIKFRLIFNRFQRVWPFFSLSSWKILTANPEKKIVHRGIYKFRICDISSVNI